MKNLIYLLFFTVVLTEININYYAYYYPSKNMLICSKEKTITENVELNEYETDNGFTCLLDLKQDEYKINLYLSMIKSGNKYELIDLSLGDNLVYNNIDLDNNLDSKEFVKRTFYVKFENANIKFSYNKCEDSSNCNYIDAKNAIINKNLLKLNFAFKRPFLMDVVLLEKQSKLVKFSASDDCDPACLHGICNEGECLCEEGYSEKDCGKGKVILI